MRRSLSLIIAMGFLAHTASGADAASTLANYSKHCVPCHAKDGTGKTTMGRKLGVKDYTDPKVVAELKDDHAIKQIKEGMKDNAGKEVMKPFGDKLKDDEIKALLEYLKAFAKK